MAAAEPIASVVAMRATKHASQSPHCGSQSWHARLGGCALQGQHQGMFAAAASASATQASRDDRSGWMHAHCKAYCSAAAGPPNASPWPDTSRKAAKLPPHLAAAMADRPAESKHALGHLRSRRIRPARHEAVTAWLQAHAADMPANAQAALARCAEIDDERVRRRALHTCTDSHPEAALSPERLRALEEAMRNATSTERRLAWRDFYEERPRAAPAAMQDPVSRVTRLATARIDDVEQSVKKLNVVAKLVRRLHVDDAIIQLSLHNRKLAAREILKAVLAARSTARSMNLALEHLVVDELICLSKKIKQRAVWYRGRGSAAQIFSRRSKIWLRLREVEGARMRTIVLQPWWERRHKHHYKASLQRQRSAGAAL